jgi:gamma-glutamyltranspeptidase/glutathione hydrolase
MHDAGSLARAPKLARSLGWLGALLLACQPSPASTASGAAAASPTVAAAASPLRVGSPALGRREPRASPRLADAIPSDWRFPLANAVPHAAHALVVSDSELASATGVDVLESGGNAADAAVAIAFVLAVVYPEAGNLGGGGFAVIRSADAERAALDFREMAPARAERDMYRPSARAAAPARPGAAPVRARTVPASSKEGHLSAGVPGSVAGLSALHRRYGSKPWRELLAPAIKLAEGGFVVDERLARSLGDARAKLEKFAGSRALLLPGGAPPRPGEVLRNPELARVLGAIAEHGTAGFYTGDTAQHIVAEMQRGGGILTLDDLARYEPRWREPIEFEYRGHTIVSMPPPSSGGVALALIANILQGAALDASGFHSSEHLHLLAEAMRRAFADRNSLLGDPDFIDVPLTALLSPAYGAERRRGIGARATPSSEVAPGLPRREGEHTTHLAVVDAEGAAVSMTTTLNDFYGSGVVVEGAGFLLNDEMDDFTTDPGKPNLYGLVQGENNAIAPHKRMLSSMAPTLVLDANGAVRAVAGARGGPRIITATWQVVSNIIDFGMNAVEAVNAPRLHQQWQPDEIALEQGGFNPDQISGLEERGHRVRFVPDLASSPVIERDAASGDWTGAADPRRGGAVAGR